MTELEQRLSALGAALEVPPAPDVASAVLSHLPTRRRRRRPARRTLAIALAAAVLVAGGAMAAPPTRHVILRILGLRGVQIERVPRLPPSSAPAGAGLKLGLGSRLPLTHVRRAVTFTPLVPPGSPAAYLGRDVPGGRLSFLSGRVLVTEFRGTATPLVLKVVGPRTKLTHLRVDGGPGVFLSRAPHEVLFQSLNGEVRADRVRLAGNVLLFDHHGLTVRIEGTHTLAQALAFARSLR